MNKLGANTRHISLVAEAVNKGAADGLVVSRVGEIDGRIVAVFLPSPTLLRYLADEIEKALP
jgi:hypothetical protein